MQTIATGDSSSGYGVQQLYVQGMRVGSGYVTTTATSAQVDSIVLGAGTYTNAQLLVRQTDEAGNVSANGSGVTYYNGITVDTTAASAPAVTMVSDTGSSNVDGITANGRIRVTGLETGASWQYSTNSGNTWTVGTRPSLATLTPAMVAGNIAGAYISNAGSATITNWDTSVAGKITTWLLIVDGSSTKGVQIEFTEAAGALQVKTVGAAYAVGNHLSDWASTAQTALSVATSDAGAGYGVKQLYVQNMQVGSGYVTSAAASALVDSFVLGDNSYTAGQILVRQTDIAGNNSASDGVANYNSLRVDTSMPTVASMVLSATGAVNNTLDAGDVVTLTVNMSEPTTVTGVPQFKMGIGSQWVYANYSGGSGTSTLTYTYTILSGQSDTDGIDVATNGQTLNGGTLRDAAGNNSSLISPWLPDNGNFKVSATAVGATKVRLTAASSDGVSSGEVGSALVQVENAVGTSITVKLGLNDGSASTITKTVQGAGYGVPVGISLTSADLQSLGAFNGKRVTINSVEAANNAGTKNDNIDYGALNLSDIAGVSLNLIAKTDRTVNGVKGTYYINDQNGDGAASGPATNNNDYLDIYTFRNLFNGGSLLGNGYTTETTTNVKNGVDNSFSVIADNFTLVLPGLADFRDNRLGGGEFTGYENSNIRYISGYDQSTTAISVSLVDGSEPYVQPQSAIQSLIVRNAGLSFAVNVSKPVAQVNLVETFLANTSGFTYSYDTGSFYRKYTTGASWEAANTSAYNFNMFGVPGHLVHVNSQAENNYINGANGYNGSPGWLGGSDKAGEGNWKWYYGSLPGEQFYDYVNNGFISVGVSVDDSYENWGVGEPGGGTSESYLQMNHPSLVSGDWLDNLPTNSGLTNQYIYEFEGSSLLNIQAYANTGSVKLTSTEAGTAYLLKSNYSVGSEAALVTLPSHLWNSAPISAAQTNKILSFEDFKTNATGWSNNTTTHIASPTYGIDDYDFLGKFTGVNGLQAVSKMFDFGAVNAGINVSIEFDMLEIDSWDGEKFNVFVNNTVTSSTAYHFAGNLIKDGGIDLGNVIDSSNGNNLNSTFTESLHHYTLQATLDHLGRVKLGFGSLLDEGISNESWGIDNVKIATFANLASVPLEGLTTGKYNLYVTDSHGNLNVNPVQTIAVL